MRGVQRRPGWAGARMAYALALIVLAGGCASGARAAPTPSSASSTLAALGVTHAVLDVGTGAALFATDSATASPVGYVHEADVRIAGPVRGNLVPVVVEGALEVHAFAPADRLYLRVQRRGQLRGSAAYVAPGNLVRVVGPGEKPERVRVEATPIVAGTALSPSVGTFPLAGLGTAVPGPEAERPQAGSPHTLPANTALPLHERPNGDVRMVLPPQTRAVACEVLFQEQGWSALRVGDGPYVVGFTSLALTPASPSGVTTAPSSATSGVPRALADETGELVRVLLGSDVTFDGRVLGHLQREGFARVLHVYPSGEVDVFVAVDDHVAVRGLVQKEQLRRIPPAVPVAPVTPAI